jgi:hypothetical protein
MRYRIKSFRWMGRLSISWLNNGDGCHDPRRLPIESILRRIRETVVQRIS